MPAAKVLVATAGVFPGDRVVDVGAGNAALLAAAAGAHVTAVDPSPRLLEVAHAAAQREGLELACEIGEAEALPVGDGSVDCVLSNFGVIFADPDAAAAEIARVLTHNGRVAFTAWVPGSAIGELAATTQDLVRNAMGEQPPPAGLRWHDEVVVRELFARHNMDAAIAGQHELAFTSTSPEAYLDGVAASHPLTVKGMEVLQQLGQADAARARALKILVERNEDPDAFRSTSRYVIVMARPR